MPLAFHEYLGAVQAAMQPAAIDIDQGQTIMPPETITPQGLAPQPAMAPAAPAYAGGNPFAGQAPAAPPPTSAHLPQDAFGPAANPIEAGVKLAQSRGELPPDAPPSAGPAPQAGATQADPTHGFPLMSAGGGGVIPAHEVDLRGPSLKRAQGGYNEAVAGAIDAGTEAHGQNAGREFALALEQERGALERQRAAEVAMAEREEEMLQQQHDFMTSAKALGQFAFKPDGGFWESRTTGQKVAGLFSLALNGFMAGVGRPVPDQVTMGIERSIRAQENAYHALRDKVGAQQNAFTMAMQKYNNLDAARVHVRVAALDALQAQAAQVMAVNKGNEIGARAAAAYADLEGQKMNQIAQGIRFLPSQATGRRFVDARTGLVYSEQEAKQMMAKLDEQQFKREEKGIDVAGNLMVEAEKAGLKREGEMRQHAVTLPNGEVVQAPNDKEADNIRALSESLAKTQRMVEEAKRIRQGWSFRAPYTEEREKLKQIQADLVSEYSVQHKFGALSEGDRKHAEEGTADLFGTGSAVEARLDRLNATALTNLQSRVKTIPGTSAGARGAIPKEAGLKFHGGK
jgi:hypothetical protein